MLKIPGKLAPLTILFGLAFIWLIKPNVSKTTPSLDTIEKAPDVDWVVTSVHDGDTIRVSKGNEKLKIRLACIDAPELKQPMGIESRDYLRSLINSSKGKVGIDVITSDRYGRKVAEIWIHSNQFDTELVQSRMLVAGMAYKYDEYKADCKSWTAVSSTESQAKNEAVGVWSGNFEKPWDYRKSSKR